MISCVSYVELPMELLSFISRPGSSGSTQHNLSNTSVALFPEMRTTATPAFPGAVDKANIVSCLTVETKVLAKAGLNAVTQPARKRLLL
jgi:hypothetical protein